MSTSAAHQAKAHAASAQIRGARAQSKRDLKSGRLSLREALDQECWQNRQVLEVLGYALIGAAVTADATWPRRSVPNAGRTALRVARGMSPPIGHFTDVSALSPARKDALVSAAGRGPAYATLAEAGLRAAS